MGFSEKIKLEVKEKAAFKCCRCRNIGVDVHHIIPEKKGGANNFDNAAPLCQNCHDQFGDNPSKRKEIRQMRDWWYKKVQEIYSKQDLSQFYEINLRLENIQKGQQKDLKELKEMLTNISNNTISEISPETASSTASSIVNNAMAVKLGPGVYSNFFCPNCNTRIGLLIGTDVCPNCKTKIK